MDERPEYLYKPPPIREALMPAIQDE